MQQMNADESRRCVRLVISRAFVARVGLRVICDMQHDPDTIDNFAAAIGVEQACHVSILTRKRELPAVQSTVELTVFALPLLNI
jgi:hypothetical protein